MVKLLHLIVLMGVAPVNIFSIYKHQLLAGYLMLSFFM